jgi:serine/threonine-protein kinase
VRVCPACGACSDDSFDLCPVDGVVLASSLVGPRVLSGRYRLERKLAEGAMGQVFQATHLALGNHVAVKVMRPQQRDVRVALKRFHKEARILGAIKHPNAVLITDFDVEHRPGGALPFFVTELLRGRPLEELLDERGRLSLVEVERIVVPLCDAVDEAHALGIVHRDLKPSNVFLERLRDGGEVVKVLDFGIAKLLSRATETPAPIVLEPRTPALDDAVRDEILTALDDDAEPLTRPGRAHPLTSSVGNAEGGHGTSTYAGLMVGTIPYMAPEQMTGEHITRRADVHAVAVLVFEMLAGRLPFDGSDEDIIDAKLSDERPSLRELGVDVPEPLDALLKACFALDPTERPDSVRTLALALTDAVRADNAESDPVSGLARVLATVTEALRGASASPGGVSVSSSSSGIARGVGARVRDALLSAGMGLDAGRGFLAALRRRGSGPPAPALVAAQLELDDALVALREQLGAVAAIDVDGAAYLQSLWRRIDGFHQEVAELFETAAPADLLDPLDAVDPLAAVLDQATPSATKPGSRASFDALVERLSGRDALDAHDALDLLLDEHLETMMGSLQTAGPRAVAIVEGLWGHADALLLRDLGVERGALRLVPWLASHPGADPHARFARVVEALRDRRGAAAVDVVARLPDPRPALRCLLLHPVVEARAAALAGLGLAEIWTVVAHPRTPVAVLAFIFGRLHEQGLTDHLKVFFLCVKDTVQTASAAELPAALGLVRAFFDVACFHEDLVFEPLLDLERAVRARADAAGLLDDSYIRAVGRFVQDGARDDVPLERLRDIPLPILRKLARDGRLLTTFVSHPNERIARETVPHLLRLDEITRFLKIVTIHRAVLIELAKRRRLFKGDVPKLALLANPRTPPVAARPFIPLLSDEQLRTLTNNRQMNPDVRKLVVQALGRPG